MKLRLIPVCLLLAGLFIPQQGLFADCICVKYPMYPYSGGNWLHYAIKTKNECEMDYALPQIQAYTQNAEHCTSSTDCDTCSNFGKSVDVATVSASHLYTTAMPNYADINTQDKIKQFLKDNTQLTGGDLTLAQMQLEGMVFESPAAAAPPVVKLRRKSGTVFSSFYAVLWKMKPQNAADWAYVGIEIADGPSTAPTVWTSDSTFRAFVMAKVAPDEELKQAVIVRGLLEVKTNNNVYLVRLFNTAENKRPEAFDVRMTRGVADTFSPLAMGLDGTGAVPNQVTGQFCCPNAMQVVPNYQYRTVYRGSRRRCR